MFRNPTCLAIRRRAPWRFARVANRTCFSAREPERCGAVEFSSAENRRGIVGMMKYLLSALTALFLFAYLAPDANAFVCARGVYRAGCVGPRGGFVVRRGPRCIWRRGVRVCRW
jgi:hypothetical protein